MSDTDIDEDQTKPAKSKKGLLVGVVGAALLGGGAYYAVNSGMVLAPAQEVAEEKPIIEETKMATFLPLTPILVSLGTGSANQLRFHAELEVEPTKYEAVENLMPRILDVLNGYLRAVDIGELKDPAALTKLRAQMLRRVQLVTGGGHVRDLLITEFVLT
ncbi:flagellar basal body-associated FliL family protein [uncultured Litoreibacter sp.]|uniref:flagellar basal body-associated FliL family protein n=1 Tax=uncultured Litoreibacter sp. TaxID=1392394 RepID=UPI00262FD1E0|nr:flagellar basal body-associated FliL family protein [uncultured Litoreibacter sp.]